MPVPAKMLAPQPTTPNVTQTPDTHPALAEVVGTPTPVSNAAAMGGLPGRPMQMLLAGQNLVGNQAVAGQALATTPERKPPAQPKAAAPPVVEEPTAAKRPEKDEAPKKEAAGPRSPGADPKFRTLTKDVATKKKAVSRSHPPATAEAGAAQAAAVPPADDREARGKAAHAEDMDSAQPKEFDKAAFVKAVQDAVAERAPKNLDEADKFGDSGKAEEVKTAVQGKVSAGKETSARDIADTTAQVPQPAPDSKAVVPLTPDRVPGKPGTPNPNLAGPDVLPPSATDMSAGPAQVNDQMAAARVTEQQLSFENSREPSFDKAVKDKKAMDDHAAVAPKRLRAGESRELKRVKDTAAAKGSAAMTGMHNARVATGRQVGTGKTGAKGRDEDKRGQVTTLLQAVFDRTKGDVEKILSNLDKMVDHQFTFGEKNARDRFTKEHKLGMWQYKHERYAPPLGPARWVADQFGDLPEEANQIYVRAKDHYLTAMGQVISGIADTVARELRRAKDRIASGRKEMRDALDKLPADLRTIGREAATEFDGRFDELTDTVDDKAGDLVETLATRYVDAVKSVDSEITAEKEKNKGLVTKAVEAVGDVIETIKELGRLLLGVLRKAASAIGAILSDPIGFLGNLVTGVGGGLKAFAKNAGRHLAQGVLAWLLGTGATTGVQLPATFDVLGILVMLASMLGLSWAAIRARLVRKVPEKAVAAAETTVPLVVAAKRHGVAGLWPDLKGMVGDLKNDLVKNLVDFLLPTVIIAGVKLIASLFNPASAFIRACKMIIDIVVFVVTQARLIIDFVNAVLDAVIAIARGNTGSAASAVENALAKAVPVLIGALAALLGLGGIPGKVKQIFHKLGRTVERAIAKVVDTIVGLVKKLWGKVKPKPGKHKESREPDEPGERRVPVTGRVPRRASGRRPARRPADRRGPGRRDERRAEDRGKQRAKDPKKKDEPADRRKRVLMSALHEAARLADRLGDEEAVRRGLPGIRARHGLSVLTVVTRPGPGDNVQYEFTGVLNPRATFEHLAQDRYLRLARDEYKEKGNRAFALTDIVGPKEVHVPGLAKLLRLSVTQARKYAAAWVAAGKLEAEPNTRGRMIYKFVELTDADLETPLEHPEYGKWKDGSKEFGLSVTEAQELWFRIIEGFRTRDDGYFDAVADVLLVNLRIPPGKGALWSEGVDLADYAAELGFTTLEKQEFYVVTKGLTFLDEWKRVRPLWAKFSARYAGRLRKVIHLFMRLWKPESIMVRVELAAVREVQRVSGREITLKFHGMAWGDDPRRILDSAVPRYWRELTRDGDELAKGKQQELDESGLKKATQIAKARFDKKQRDKQTPPGKEQQR
ncbi:hypothetical protein [Amycolatopsis sp. cmx-4-68]|uniref:phage tail protein n=1 Tax=Amycolatopsis sp. cmx-4-68 TaxID=2790938 RepID=UPI00397AC6D9